MDDDEAMDVTSGDPEPPQPGESEDDEAKDFTSFNSELLQLPEVSPMVLNARSEHVQGMFKQWLSLPKTSKMLLMNSLIANALGNPVNADAAGSSSSSSTFPGTSAPLHQPRSLSSSHRITEQSNCPLSLGFPLNLAHHPSQEQKEQFISRINQIFHNPLDGLQIEEFKSVTKEVCKLPSFFTRAFFRKIDIASTGLVTRDALIKYWVDGNMLTMNTATQIYNILKHPGREYLSQFDFEPILEELLATHPGLAFLQDLPDIKEVYAETVIYRIFYLNDRSTRGRLTLRDLKRGRDLIEAMQQLDGENDVNKVQRYFSYRHVFVIDATFGKLASGDDFMIQKENLIRYADYSLNRRVVDRLFSEVPRKFTSDIPGKMDYEDFVYFLLSEEDKTTESSIEYWFKCLDLDGNEKITPDEMKYFYEGQMIRIRSKRFQRVPFAHTLRQIIDMISPEREDYITLRDFKRSKLSGNVFNTLFNLKKYLQSQLQKETELRKKEEEKHPDWTEWDHFVHREFPALREYAEDEDEDEDADEDEAVEAVEVEDEDEAVEDEDEDADEAVEDEDEEVEID